MRVDLALEIKLLLFDVGGVLEQGYVGLLQVLLHASGELGSHLLEEGVGFLAAFVRVLSDFIVASCGSIDLEIHEGVIGSLDVFIHYVVGSADAGVFETFE